MFLANGKPNCFLMNLSKKIGKLKALRLKDKEKVNEEKLLFSAPYLGKPSQIFVKQLSRLIASLITVKLILMYETFKVSNYLNLKSRIPTPLVFNVVYRFSCPREADMTYIGKSASTW